MKESLKILKGLSDETRLKILEFLLDGEKCVCEIMPYVNRTASTVSIQLSKLESANLVESRREGQKVFYKITNYKVIDVFKVLGFSKSKVLKSKCCRGK